MNIPLEILFAIAMILLGLERLVPTNLPPWVAGILLILVGLAVLL